MANDHADGPQPGDQPLGTWADSVYDNVQAKDTTEDTE
jgi:hypothetical protein